MHSLRKWFYRPKKEDSSKLAHFYWADEELTMVATELDSFDGRTDPDRCSILVSQLRICQDKVLSICNEIMEDAIPDMRANRDFRAKFPDDVLHENLAGQLWFGAECLAAGSNIMNRELESAGMRPLAKALTRALDNVRCLLREQSLKNSVLYSDKVKASLRIFDRLFAEFELCYVSAMVPIKSAKEYHLQQEIVVLFSETLIRALKMGLVTQDIIDDYDPSLMFTIPRLAIVWGLLLFPEGPLNVDRESVDMSELFRPFCSLLFKIRDLLWTLTRTELQMLEKMLCSQEEPQIDEKADQCDEIPIHTPEDYINKFYLNNSNCKQFIQDFYAYNFGIIVGEDASQEVTTNVHQPLDCTEGKVDSYCKEGEIEVVKLQNPSEQSKAKPTKLSESSSDTPLSCETSPSHLDCSTPLASDLGMHEIHEQMNMYSHCDVSQNSDSHNEMKNNDSDEAFSDEELRTNTSTLRPQVNHMPFRDSQSFPSCDNSSEMCSYSTGDVEPSLPSSVQEALCFERSLSALHDQCTCAINAPQSSGHITPSRELLRQVMRHVEIVPPGHHITGYSSSPESSPRAYHHGLLSHSFPTHTACNAPLPLRTPQHVPASKWCRRKQKPSRHRNLQNGPVRFNCDISSPRHYYNCYSPVSNPAYFPLFRNSETLSSTPLTIPQVQSLRDSAAAAGSDHTYSSCSSCQSISSVSSPEWESTSPDTSSYNSECQDDEEIALALQAAEIASRNKARSRFKSSSDLLHKLFVCISGVADQLQTNYASDLRNILKSVFVMNCSQTQPSDLDSPLLNSEFRGSQDSDIGHDSVMQDMASCGEQVASPPAGSQTMLSVELTTEPLSGGEQQDEDERDHSSVDSAEEAVPDGSPTPSLVISEVRQNSENFINEGMNALDPPAWLPDELSSHCMACKVPFTILRRRHHCRNCGKIFCSRCSSNSIPLPRFGHLKPVRVCNQCFMYQLTSLVMQQQL